MEGKLDGEEKEKGKNKATKYLLGAAYVFVKHGFADE